MNRSNLILTLALGCSMTARAGTYDATFNSGFANSGYIPAGSLSGFSDSETITSSQITGTLSSITVNLDVAGGYNGSLYGYLEYNGVLVTLLNRSGVGTTSGGTPFGYGNSGFNVTFDSSAADNIHFYQNYSPTITGGQLTGTWAPDGTAISPLSSPASFNTPGGQTLNSFNGMSPDGTWTLFLADVASGGGTPQVLSYSLDLTTVVPEPVNVALGIFGGVFLIGAIWRKISLRSV